MADPAHTGVTGEDGRPLSSVASTADQYHDAESSSGGTAVDPRLAVGGSGDEQTRSSSNSSFIADLNDDHVHVARAKEEFAALERRYSAMSQNSNDLHRTTTGLSLRQVTSRFGGKPERTTTRQTVATQASAAGVVDAEKGEATAAAGDEVEFNLADELRHGRSAQDAADIKHKRVGVIWEDLEVIGAGGMKMHIRNFTNAVIEQFMMPVVSALGVVGYKPFAPKPKTILASNSGVLKPGEMCLVLGRPGAGCSTFLKTIANQRDGFMAVNGNVEYAGVGWKEMYKLYAGEVLYNQEDE